MNDEPATGEGKGLELAFRMFTLLSELTDMMAPQQEHLAVVIGRAWARGLRAEPWEHPAVPAGCLLRASAEGPIVATIWLEPAGQVIWHKLVRHRDDPGWEYGVGDCRLSALKTLDGDIRPEDRHQQARGREPRTWPSHCGRPASTPTPCARGLVITTPRHTRQRSSCHPATVRRMGSGPEEAAITHARRALVEAVAAADRTERMMRVVGAVGVALADLGLRPVIVGGLAVEYWTRAYATADIDVLLPTSDEVVRRLGALGFERHGRVWRLIDQDVIWEMPGTALDVLDEATEVELPGGTNVLVLRLEDILVHRVEEFVATGHADVARQAVALIAHPGLDDARLRERASASRHVSAVEAIRQLAARAQRGERFESAELHQLARQLRADLGHAI